MSDSVRYRWLFAAAGCLAALALAGCSGGGAGSAGAGAAGHPVSAAPTASSAAAAGQGSAGGGTAEVAYTGAVTGTLRADSASCTRRGGALLTFAAPAGSATQSGVVSLIGANMASSGPAEWALTLQIPGTSSDGFVAGSVPGVRVTDAAGAHPQVSIASTQLASFDSSGKQVTVTANGTVECGSVKDVP